jgi:hypothetical protein
MRAESLARVSPQTLINSHQLVQILMKVFASRAVISTQLSCNSCSRLTGA